jgi:hypothetical protein
MNRPPRLALFVLLGLLASWEAPGPCVAQDEPDTPEGTAAAIYTLKVDLDLEKSRLDHRLSDYADSERRREELRDQISAFYVRIGFLVRQGEPAGEEDESLESLVEKTTAAELADVAARDNLRRLREQIADSRERIRILQDRIAGLRRAVPPEPESLSGTWDVTLLPGGDRAVFTLKQAGTIISGEYTQDGGWKGSLQGTLVNNKLVLHRIDSKLGPSSDLDGVVSSDLRSVKGNWQSRVLSDGSASTGAWSARKREAKKKGDGGAP